LRGLIPESDLITDDELIDSCREWMNNEPKLYAQIDALDDDISNAHQVIQSMRVALELALDVDGYHLAANVTEAITAAIAKAEGRS
jgi:hypothetical protein